MGDDVVANFEDEVKNVSFNVLITFISYFLIRVVCHPLSDKIQSSP